MEGGRSACKLIWRRFVWVYCVYVRVAGSNIKIGTPSDVFLLPLKRVTKCVEL